MGTQCKYNSLPTSRNRKHTQPSTAPDTEPGEPPKYQKQPLILFQKWWKIQFQSTAQGEKRAFRGTRLDDI